jgi:hypothetical protein
MATRTPRGGRHERSGAATFAVVPLAIVVMVAGFLAGAAVPAVRNALRSPAPAAASPAARSTP